MLTIFYFRSSLKWSDTASTTASCRHMMLQYSSIGSRLTARTYFLCLRPISGMSCRLDMYLHGWLRLPGYSRNLSSRCHRRSTWNVSTVYTSLHLGPDTKYSGHVSSTLVGPLGNPTHCTNIKADAVIFTPGWHSITPTLGR